MIKNKIRDSVLRLFRASTGLKKVKLKIFFIIFHSISGLKREEGPPYERMEDQKDSNED